MQCSAQPCLCLARQLRLRWTSTATRFVNITSGTLTTPCRAGHYCTKRTRGPGVNSQSGAPPWRLTPASAQRVSSQCGHQGMNYALGDRDLDRRVRLEAQGVSIWTCVSDRTPLGVSHWTCVSDGTPLGVSHWTCLSDRNTLINTRGLPLDFSILKIAKTVFFFNVYF